MKKVLTIAVSLLLLMWMAPGAFSAGNLIKNGGFEESREDNQSFPRHWKATEKKHVPSEYVAENVSLVPGRKGKALKINLTKSVAEGPGLGLISDWIEIDPKSRYRIKIDVKTNGPIPIVWCKGYTLEKGERKGCYDRSLFPKPKSQDWETFSAELPRKSISERGKAKWEQVNWMRIKVYSYYPQGEIYFDNVSLRKTGSSGIQFLEKNK